MLPEWIIRVHVVGSLTQEQQDRIVAHPNVEMVRCSRETGANGAVRLLAIDDPGVLYVVSRDWNTRISVRDVMAIQEWMGTGLALHVVRDHQTHNAPLDSSRTGVYQHRPPLDNQQHTPLIHLALQAQQSNKKDKDNNWEDAFTTEYLWPAYRKDALVHDSYPERCGKGEHTCKDFPIPGGNKEEEGYYVGAHLDKKIEGYDCRVECTA